MTTIERSIDVDVPVRRAYDQWTQFEDFPRFMEGVEQIDRIDEESLHWVTSIAGVTREFDARITEQMQDSRISWRSVDGPKHAGVVTLLPVNSSATRINVQMTYAPEGVTEKVGDMLGMIESRVEKDLERFKSFVERGSAEVWA